MTEEKSRPSTFWLLVALVVGILIVGDLTRRMTDARRMERESARLAEQVAALEISNSELEKKIAGALDDANVARWARSEAKLVLEGERLVVPVPVDEIDAPDEADVSPAVEAPSPWEVWWALLIGG